MKSFRRLGFGGERFLALTMWRKGPEFVALPGVVVQGATGFSRPKLIFQFLDGILYLIEIHLQPGNSFVPDDSAQEIRSLGAESGPGLNTDKEQDQHANANS